MSPGTEVGHRPDGVQQGTPATQRWAVASHRRPRMGGWVAFVAALTLLFIEPLVALISHALANELHSHTPLVPLSAYLLYLQGRSSAAAQRRCIPGAAMLGVVGTAALATAIGFGYRLTPNDYLTLTTLAYISFVAAGGFLFLGAEWMAGAAFPFAFLIFMVPLPDAAVGWLENVSVQASAEVAALLFDATGTPLLRDGTILRLPGIALKVAEECSGIRSSWALFITSVLAAQMFLKNPWRRLVLVMFVIPLGIVRNAFRILVIGLLCVHIGPHMIGSLIHRRGGPLFFVLSLAPLFLLLWWLRRRERRQHATA